MKKLFFTHTIALFRVVFILLALGYSATAEAQLKFTASDMVRISPNSPKWRYNDVQCSGNVKVTSITISMINNDVDSLTSSIKPSTRLYSLGKDPRTYTYLFDQTITIAQVVTFVKGIVFIQTADVPTKPQYIHLYVDANPTNLPPGAKITVWKEHPDGSVHYYVWVPVRNVSYMDAYNGAKGHYFQGMRGYLPTITSLEETKLLSNISNIGGWSAGGRTPDDINDQKSISKPPTRENSTDKGKNFRWLCGPESGFVYYYGPRRGGPANGASVFFSGNEPNDFDTGENLMQINFGGAPAETSWNDLNATGYGYVHGYFIEFGGNGKAYRVGAASYPENPLYKTPTQGTTNNNQWHNYSAGATAVSEATVKQRTMRSHVMVIE